MALPGQISSIYSKTSVSSEVLDRALRLGSRFSTSDVLEELAGQMGFPFDPLGDAAHDVLGSLHRVLGANIEEEGPWNWVVDIEARRHFRIAERAVEQQTIDRLLVAAHELGWWRRRLEVSEFSDVAKAVRNAFSSLLADRVRKLLEDWLNDNVWNHDLESRHDRIARTRRENEKRPLPPAG